MNPGSGENGCLALSFPFDYFVMKNLFYVNKCICKEALFFVI